MLYTLNTPRAVARPRTLFRAAAAGIVALLFVWAAINWYQSLASIARFYEPLPFQDYWVVAQHLHQYQNLDFRVLWQPHNEHRIVFPELVFACDVLFAKGRRILPLLCSVACYFGVLFTLALVVFRDREWPAANRWAAVLLAAAVMGWKGSAFVLAEPFLLQWTLTQVAVVVSLALLAEVPHRGSRFLAGSIIAAVIATYSSGNGMLLWPILILAGLALQLRRREMVVLAISGMLAAGLYFIGYRSASRLNLSNFYLHPLYSLEFLGAYMSMPFGGMKAPRFGAYVGLSSMAVMLVLVITAFRRRFLQTAPAVLLFGSYAFVVLTGILTAAGRMDVQDRHYAGAEATRYLSLPLANWAVFTLACIWAAARSRARLLGPWTLTTLFAVLLLAGFPKLRWWIRGNERAFIQAQLTSLAVENGLTDNNLLATIFPDPPFVRSRLPELRSAHLSVFSYAMADIPGKPLGRFGRVSGESNPGELTYMYPVENGLEIAGFVTRDSSNKRILLANEKGTIVGFGRRLPAGFPPAIPAPGGSGRDNWIGFANLSYPSKSVSAYAVAPAGLALLGTVQVPEERVINPADMGGPIGPISWTTEGGPASDRIPTTAPPPAAKPPGPIYSTAGNGDAEQATIRSSAFEVPGGRCLILPILFGPSTQALSVVIVDGETGQVLARVPTQNESAAWSYWRIPIARGVASVRIAAQDRGSGLGQWLAVAGPRHCD